MSLEHAELRVGIGVGQQSLVEADGLVDLPLLLEAFRLPHLGGQAGQGFSIVLVQRVELSERGVE